MIDTRLLSKDPVTGLERWFHFDTETEEFHIETTQDVKQLLEATQAKQAEEEHAPRGDLHWVGSVPLNTYYDLKRLYPDPKEFEMWVLKWLEDNNKFKTRRHERLF